MPTPLDRALQSKSAFWAFAGTIGVVSAWAIWGGDMFPQQPPTKPASKVVEPKGDPQKWTEEQLLAWAKIHGVQTTGNETREELLAMVESKMNEPRV